MDYTLKPSFATGCKAMATPSDARLYIGNADCKGPFYESLDPSPTPSYEATPWTPYSTDVLLDVERGFSAPSAVGQRLTSQLHARQGTAAAWETSTVQAKLFSFPPLGGALQSQPVPAVTDSTYLTFPSSTGKVLYAKELGKWSADLEVPPTAVAVDNNYRPWEARDVYYSHVMTRRPVYYKATTQLISMYQQQPMCGSSLDNLPPGFDYTIHSGNVVQVNTYDVETTRGQTTHTFPTGDLGNHCCLIDTLPWTEAEYTYWHSNGDDSAFVTANLAKLELTDGDFIGTNLLWTPEVLSTLPRRSRTTVRLLMTRQRRASTTTPSLVRT
jgi:hypothetical protein